MPKDLLEKFDKQFDELIVFQTYEIPMIVKDDIKSLSHSHIEEAYKSNLERLIEKCGDRFWRMMKAGKSWTVEGGIGTGELRVFGSTPTEAVENLIKSLNK